MAVKWVSSFLGSRLQIWEEGQNLGNVAKESILRAARTVFNDAANWVNKGKWEKQKEITESLNTL